MTAKEIIAFVLAFPTMISLGVKILKFIEKAFSADPVKFMRELSDTFDRLDTATTKEEYKEASEKISSILNNIGS